MPGTITGNKLFPTTWISYTTYADNRIANVFFIGAKYAVTSQIDVAAAYYYLEQNNYNSSDHALRLRQHHLRRTQRTYLRQFHA